jgi:hypothetical protein
MVAALAYYSYCSWLELGMGKKHFYLETSVGRNFLRVNQFGTSSWGVKIHACLLQSLEGDRIGQFQKKSLWTWTQRASQAFTKNVKNVQLGLSSRNKLVREIYGGE